MEVNSELKLFVQKKKSKSALQEKLYPLSLLEFLEQDILNLYKEKLDKHSDEFDEQIGMSIKDQNYFRDVFFPTALLKTYQKVHVSTPVSDCLEECFTLGAGSETYSLVPELNGICETCAGDYFSHIQTTQIYYINLLVLRKQIKHKFMDPKFTDPKFMNPKFFESKDIVPSSSWSLEKSDDQSRHSGVNEHEPTTTAFNHRFGLRSLSGSGKNITPRSGSNIKSGTGNNIKSGTGSNIKTGTGSKIKSGTGSKIKSRTGSNIKSGTGSNINSGSGSSTKSGTGSSINSFKSRTNVKLHYCETMGSGSRNIRSGSDINTRDRSDDIKSVAGNVESGSRNIKPGSGNAAVHVDDQDVVDENMVEDGMENSYMTDELIVYNPFSSLEMKDFEVYNPFIKRSRSSFKCHFCGKSFTESSFVEMHKLLFHQQPHQKTPQKMPTKVQLKYVDSSEALMTTFHIGDHLKHNELRPRRRGDGKKKLDM